VNLPSDIGLALVGSRRAQGLTQRQLAERLGVTQPQIARWESNGYRSASLERLDAVARALGINDIAAALTAAPLVAEAPAAYAAGTATLAKANSSTADRALRRLGVSAESIAAFCRLHGIREMALFGSAVRTDFGPESDVDVLVTWEPNRTPEDFSTLLDLELELRAIFRRDVDLVDRRTIEKAENRIRRDRILEGSRIVYVAG
jgi:predicted nucleotidyltransferase/DNA-binding XRE family transcriptional regulator